VDEYKDLSHEAINIKSGKDFQGLVETDNQKILKLIQKFANGHVDCGVEMMIAGHEIDRLDDESADSRPSGCNHASLNGPPSQS